MAEQKGRVSSKRSTGTKYKDLDKKFKFLVVFGIIFCIAGIPMIIWGGIWAYNTFGISEPVYPPTLDDIESPDNDGNVNLYWSPVPDTMAYEIYRNDIRISSVQSNSYIDAGLTNGVYSYKIKAVLMFSESDFSNTESVTVVLTVYQLLTPIFAIISTSPNTDGNVVLLWNSVVNAEYYVMWRSKNSGVFNNIGSTGSTSYTDTGLTDGTYEYYIYAGAVGYTNSPNSIVKSIIVSIYVAPPIVYTATTPILNSIESPDSDGIIDLSWNVGLYTIKYNVYRNDVLIKITTLTSYTDTGLTDGTYNYKVKAIGTDANSEYSNIESVTVQFFVEPIVPVTTIVNTITPNPDTDGSITISWLSISDAVEYELYRSTDSVSYSKLTTVSKTSFTDYRISDGTYYYKVICVGTNANSGYSNIESVVVEIPSVIVLVLPTNPSITINSGDLSTNSFDVSLTLSCNDADEMRFKLTSDSIWTDWEAYSTTKSITLPETSVDNPYIYIYVQFSNDDGKTGEYDAGDGITYIDNGDEEEEEDDEEPPDYTMIYILVGVLVLLSMVAVILIWLRKRRVISDGKRVK